MSLGICMKAMNAIHFNNMLDFYYEFIPQIILMLCLFGWMDLLIIVKWMTNWEGRENRAPGIVSVMINMFLNFGAINEETTDSLVGSPGTQQSISILLLIVSLICIPSMLLIKPYFIYKEMQEHHESDKDYQELQNVDSGELKEIEEEKEEAKIEAMQDADITILINQGTADSEHNFGEMFIHQLIETIEFALGTVSNTASYLRLWALSLAHGQLADVFFEKLIRVMALDNSNAFLLFVLFPVFASFSFFVLM